jgi:DNA-binding FadR family transcriptional regulator
VPLYFQLAVALTRAIEEGDLPAGTRLDNEIDLARRLGISRPTVRRAIEHAVRQGLLVRRRASEPWSPPVRVSRAIRLTSLYNDLEAAGQRPAT